VYIYIYVLDLISFSMTNQACDSLEFLVFL
jgi:hypothetical protein